MELAGKYMLLAVRDKFLKFMPQGKQTLNKKRQGKQALNMYIITEVYAMKYYKQEIRIQIQQSISYSNCFFFFFFFGLFFF